MRWRFYRSDRFKENRLAFCVYRYKLIKKIPEELMNEKKKEIKVEYSKEIIGGVYANTVNIMHTPEEFIMDFYLVAPPSGITTARVIISPGHMKRVMSAIKKNIELYENKFGEIRPAREPEHGPNIGFKP
jgi:hypothetical protein